MTQTTTTTQITAEEKKADRLFTAAVRRAEKAIDEVAVNRREAQATFRLIDRLYNRVNSAEIFGRPDRREEYTATIQQLMAICRNAEETARQGRMWVNASKSWRIQQEQRRNHRLSRGCLL